MIGTKCPELTAEESLWWSNVNEQKLNGPCSHVAVVFTLPIRLTFSPDAADVKVHVVYYSDS